MDQRNSRFVFIRMTTVLVIAWGLGMFVAATLTPLTGLTTGLMVVVIGLLTEAILSDEEDEEYEEYIWIEQDEEEEEAW